MQRRNCRDIMAGAAFKALVPRMEENPRRALMIPRGDGMVFPDNSNDAVFMSCPLAPPTRPLSRTPGRLFRPAAAEA